MKRAILFEMGLVYNNILCAFLQFLIQNKLHTVYICVGLETQS